MCKIVRSPENKFFEVKQKLNNFNFIHIYYKLFRTYLANFHRLVLELHAPCLARNDCYSSIILESPIYKVSKYEFQLLKLCVV